MTWCPDVCADKPHPRFDKKFGKVWAKRCSLYAGVYGISIQIVKLTK